MFKFDWKTNEVEKRFQKLESNADSIVEEIVADLGMVALKSARHNVPVLTGDLKGSLAVEVNKTGETSTAEIGASMDYAGAVEYGTSKQSPQPYLRPALDDAERESPQVIKAVFNKYDK